MYKRQISYGTTSAKLREAITIVQQVLATHDKMAEGARARLGNITDRAFNIEVFSYIDVPDFDTQVVIREELLLTIYERLEAAGIGLAFPTQTVFYAPQRAAATEMPTPVGIGVTASRNSFAKSVM